jgi:tetratricopeptide (TPR) repeat protein
MRIHHHFRVRTILLSISVIILAIHPARARAEPYEGIPGQTLLAGDGRYVITSYSGPFVVIWDMDNLWDYLQPVQVHAFRGDASITTGSMSIAVSEDGNWLAYFDHGEGAIRVCGIKPGFPCRTVPGSASIGTNLELSPDGSQLLLWDSYDLRLFSLGGARITVQEHALQNEYVRADWPRKRLAVLRPRGTVEILSLVNFSLQARLEVTPTGSGAINFTYDGKHLIWMWQNWIQDKLNYDEGVKIYPLDAAPSTLTEIEPLKNISKVIPGSSPFELWYARFMPPSSWALIPMGSDGSPQENERITLSTGESARLLAVSIKRNLVIVEDDFDLFVYSLESRLPMFSLYNSKVNYYGGPLPHLYPHLGADPIYDTLMRLSYSSFEGRKNTLLWTASLATVRHDRFDQVWFSLLDILERDASQGDAYLRLNELVEMLVKLNRVAYLTRAEDHVAALQLLQGALRARRSAGEPTTTPPALDIYNPSLDALVANYWRVLERDMWLSFGNHLAAVGRNREAGIAYREALKIEPQEWRAYQGLLNIYRGASDASFDALLAEAQSNLKMVGLTDQLDLGYPPYFFRPDAVRKFRSTQP